MRLINFFSGADEKFVRENFKDQHEAEKLIASFRKRATIGLLVAVSFLAITSVAVVYAVIQINKTETVTTDLQKVQTQIDQCAENTKKQSEDAAKASAEAERVNKEILARLDECNRKKK